MTVMLFIIIFIKVQGEIIAVVLMVIPMLFQSNCFGSRLSKLYIFRVVVVATVADFDYFVLCFTVVKYFISWVNLLELVNCFVEHFGFKFSFVMIDYFFLHSFQIHRTSKNQRLSTIRFPQIYSYDLILLRLLSLNVTHQICMSL